MTISIIVAVAKNGIIGKENDLPWRLSEDLKHFKRTTLGKPVIMGRKTYESVGKPLPGRRNIVVSRNPSYEAEGCEVAHSIEEAIDWTMDADEVMILGGGRLYSDALPLTDRIYLTQV
ncbi:MAG: dihydrofolate reductase, partial [Candidatus Omnitrophica bacterium]|nr:dihydrofolate reductase [Candidatus Omnitrophota bacterium]